jgi:SPX domain protein involved in polyphosphate accumulation
MVGPHYQDRIERSYEVALNQEGVVDLWRDLTEFLPEYGLQPIDGITCVGTVYFDNKDYDLTHYTILNPDRRMLVRLRTYETYDESSAPISDYWLEVKIRANSQWKKKRFRLSRADLSAFLQGRDATEVALAQNRNGDDPEVILTLYREIQELVLTMGLKPFFLLTYKRMAFQNETERLSLDWDLQYYSVGSDVYGCDSWQYPIDEPVGISDKTILELKYGRGSFPTWIADLEKRYPIQETGFLKFVEGMQFLFQGPLKSHREAEAFLRLIYAYGGESRPLG